MSVFGFASLPHKRGESVPHVFSKHGFWWRLSVFPRGSLASSQKVEHVSVILDLVQSSEKQHQRRPFGGASYSIQINSKNVQTSPTHANFIQRDIVLDPTKGVLENDGALVVIVTIQLQLQLHGDLDASALKPSSLLSKMKDATDLQDITFVVEGERFRAHKLLLRALAPGLAQRAAIAENDVVLITDISLFVFKKLHEYIYHGIDRSVFLDVFEVVDLLGAAHRLECTDLKMELESLLLGLLTVKTSVFSFIFSSAHVCGLLMEASMDLIVRHWEDATKCPFWPIVAAQPVLLCKLLQHSCAVAPEKDVATLRMLLAHAGKSVDGCNKTLARRWEEISTE